MSARIFKSKLEPNDIFNPRGQYDEEMYVSRPDYEKKLKSALLNDMCILVHGQSGTGKTWLTRSVLEKEKYYYKPINLASASNYESIYECFRNIMVRDNWEIRSKYSEGKNASVGITGLANGGLNHINEYDAKVDYFMEFLKFMAYRAKEKEKKRYIVFENFESIIGNDAIIKELTNLITIIDDDEVAKYNTNFIIIGATKEIHKYFANLPNVNTIENRIFELPEVSTLSTLQAFELIVRGFRKLEIEFANDDLLKFYQKEITKSTGGIPQRLQELCLKVSILCKENDWTATRKIIEEAKKDWITTSLIKNYVSMTRILDYDEKSSSLKNRILYCVAQKDNMTFRNTEVDKDLKSEFDNLADAIDINSAIILDEFCNTKPPLLEKLEFTNEYSFVDFKYALCLRTMLYKYENEVQKLNWDEI